MWKIRLGDGTLLTVMENRGNATADEMAKLAAEEHQVPEHIRVQILEHEHLV